MQCAIGNKQYTYCANAMLRADTRASYFALANSVFGLDFNAWFSTGFPDDHYVAYTLCDGDKSVSSVGVCTTDMQLAGTVKRCAQISTVMTDRKYRGLGLNRWLMEKVLDKWEPKCDVLYLYANDSVLDFYPKFGFVTAIEYQNHRFASPNGVGARRLDMTMPDNIRLLAAKFAQSNPFSAFAMLDNVAQVVFHCTSFRKDDVYYIDEYDAIVVGKSDGDSFLCCDIFTDTQCSLDDVLGALVEKDNTPFSFGFALKPDERSELTPRQRGLHSFRFEQ